MTADLERRGERCPSCGSYSRERVIPCENVWHDQALVSPIRDVTDPAEVDEIRRRALGRDLRPQEPVKPMFKPGDIHPSGATVLASFPGLGPVGLSRLNEADRKAVTTNVAEAIHHQFTVAQMIVWETMPTRRRGIRSAPWKGGTIHYVEACPALRKAKWAKMRVLQRQPTGLPFEVEERGCKICARLEAEIAREREQAAALARLALPAPVEWDPVELTDQGEPRWAVLHPTEMLSIERAQLAVKVAYDRERLPDPASVRIDVSTYVDKIYVLDLYALNELPQRAGARSFRD